MKEFLGLLTVLLCIIGYAPYIKDSIYGKTQPHIFSWITWSIIGIIAFLGQWAKGGGAGSWGTGIAALLIIFITFLAIPKGTKDITKLDKLFFLLALSAIVPWYLTLDPTLSVVIACITHTFASIPTIRKTLANPKSETLSTYSINMVRHFLSLFALAQYNLATILYPIYLLIFNIIMNLIILKSNDYKKIQIK